MSIRYFYNVMGTEFGPVEAATIQDLLNQGTLGLSDRIRQDGGPWRNVAELVADADSSSDPSEIENENQQAASNREMQQLFVECIERQRPAGTRQPVYVPKAAAGPRLSAQLIRVLLGIVTFPIFLLSTFGDWIIWGISWLSRGWTWPARTRTPRRSVVTGFNQFVHDVKSTVIDFINSLIERVVSFFSYVFSFGVVRLSILVLIFAALIPRIPVFWVTQSYVYSVLLKTRQEFQDLRDSEVDESAWSEFQQRSTARLSKLVPQLEAKADVSNPASLALLGITRDDLPQLLNEPRQSSMALERKINVRMAQVETAIASGGWPNLTWLRSGWRLLIFSVDIAVVAGILIIIKRRRSRAASTH